jgi:hypothetical protein
MNLINKHLEGLTKHLSKLAEIIPGEIEKAKKNLSQEDIKLIEATLKDVNFDESLKEYEKTRVDLKNFLKNY